MTDVDPWEESLAGAVLIPTEEAEDLPLFHYTRALLEREGHEVRVVAVDAPLPNVSFAVAFGMACRRAGEVGRGVWLSPAFDEPETAEALMGAKGPGLVVGSLGDARWDRAAAARLRQFEILHLHGVDRRLEVVGDPMGSIDVMRRVLLRIAETVRRLP